MAEVSELFPKRKNPLVSALSGDFQVPRPDALQPFHLASPDERRRRIRRVLIKAWSQWRFGELNLVDAVREAGGPGAEAEYALTELRRVLLEINLWQWEAHPARVRADVTALFRRAIGRLTPHRGGWRCSAPVGSQVEAR